MDPSRSARRTIKMYIGGNFDNNNPPEINKNNTDTGNR
jgi:hypothetical protein